MELKPGYKQTEMGVIPEEWTVTTLGAVYSFTNGFNSDKTAYGSGTKFINVLEPINLSHITAEKIPGRVRVTESQASAYAVRAGDIVLNRTSETDEDLGKIAVYTGIEHVVFGGFVIRGRQKTDTFDPAYSGYALRSEMVRTQIISLGQGAVRANISQQSLQRVFVVVPPKHEQLAIARALLEIDQYLSNLDQLIAKKRDIKQAAMQELLTGKRRLPGFEGEWELKRLGEHVKFLRNGVNSRAELHLEGSIKYLHYGDIHASADSFLSPQHLPCLSGAKAARLDRLRNGDLIFADASEDIAGVSKSVEILGACKSEVVSGLHTIAARFDKAVLADGFKGFLQYVPSFYAHLRRLAAGTKVYATNRAHILSAEVRLPPVAEQKAIASVLIDMSNELDLLRDRMNKALSTKQGMMQQLLTGKIRLR